MKKVILLAVAVLVAGGFAAQSENWIDPYYLPNSAPNSECKFVERRCRAWISPSLRVEFPERMADFRLSRCGSIAKLADWHWYMMRYDFEDGREVGNRGLDLYVYSIDYEATDEDKFMAELRKTSEAMKRMYPGVKDLGMVSGGKLAKTELKYLWTSFEYSSNGGTNRNRSVSLVTAWRGRFVRLCYWEEILKKGDGLSEELPKGILPFLDALDMLFANAMAAAAVDVYGISKPEDALAALRRKWLGADIRVPMVDMPDYLEYFREIDKVHEWCGENMDERAVEFENVAREGVMLRIEPPIWCYNLACALARQKLVDPAFEALEEAIAAGYNKVDHAEKDADLASLHADPRFGKLMSMAHTVETRWNEPKRMAKVVDGVLSLDEDNIYYLLRYNSYRVDVETDIEKPIIYLDHNAEHGPVPEGMIGVKFSKVLRQSKRDVGTANIHFVDVRSGDCIPIVLASDFAYNADGFNEATSIPAGLIWQEKDSFNEFLHFTAFNTLGIYSAGADYGIDGVDRFLGRIPVGIAHAGGKEDALKFAQLCRDFFRAMPEKNGPVAIALNYLIRRSQKCVTNEASFMSGIAHRPVISLDDIDLEKARTLARAIKEKKVAEYLVSSPFFKETHDFSEGTHITDLWHAPYFDLRLPTTPFSQSVAVRWGDNTTSFSIGMLEISETLGSGVATNGWRYAWKVLQGDENKVRIEAKNGDASQVRIEVDYHAVFDVPLANGKTVKSSRVDIGCFLVNGKGYASVPSIVSVYFSPNETREYDAKGRLVSIDYTKRQIERWRPNLCAKGNWKDVFRYSDSGEMIGWTRFSPNADGSVKTNEVSRDGLVVMTRDALGRPKDVRRDLTMTWMQDFNGRELEGEKFDIHQNVKGMEFDNLDCHPCGKLDFTTLAWRYEYRDNSDFRGIPSPKPFRQFAYSPELCKRADFSEASGFVYPFVNQMMAGYVRYVNFKYGLAEESVPSDYIREDGPTVLREKGLVPPKVLKKMTFCPWRPSTNDFWGVWCDDYVECTTSNLIEQADGAYRFHSRKHDCYLSVANTYTTANRVNEHCAYAILDNAYKRVCKRGMMESDSKTVATDGTPLYKEDLPDGAESSMAIWCLPNRNVFCIKAYHNFPFAPRRYIFVRDGNYDLPRVSFSELPSRAIGNTVLRAFADDAEALNNLAVLLYAEVANYAEYKESVVVDLLKRSAEKGCATALRNLEVLRYNRGEK